MILIVLGTQDKTFERLLRGVERQIDLKNIKDKVVVQAGQTKYESNKMEIFDFIPMTEFNELIKKADIIITHGGVGTILSCLEEKKKIIAVPRLKKYMEHENDHQLQIVDEFEKLGYIISCKDENKLDEALEKIKNFKPKPYKQNNLKMLKIIEDYIDNI